MCANSAIIDGESILKRAVCHQDKDVVAILYTKYYEHIKHFIASHIGSVADVEDLTQDVFTELCKAMAHYDGRGTIKGYLFGIATNVIRNYIRHQQKNIKTIHIDATEDTSICPNIRPDHNIAGTLPEQEMKIMIRELKTKLSPKVYEAVALRFFERLPPKEAAHRIGCSVEAFKKRLQRAARVLEQIIKQRSD
jgi:RNA polymerase sigma-70 factor (ECF subfamily)